MDAAVADLRRSLDPAALTEIKRSLAALSEQKLPRGLEGRIESLSAELGVVAQRVDTLSSTVSATAAGVAGRDGDVVALRRAFETATARIDAELSDVRRVIDPTPVVELRQAVKELSDAAFAQKRSNQHQLAEAGAKIDTLVGQLDAYAMAMAATATRVSGSEAEISALRASAQDGDARLSSFAAELNQSIATLAARAAALEDADHEAVRLLETSVSGVRGNVDELAARLDSLTETVGTTSERLGEQDVELAGIERRYREASSRVDALVGDLTHALEEFPNPESLEQALEARIDRVVAQVAELDGHLAEVKADLAERARDATAGSVELERLLVAERGKVEDLTDQLDSLATAAAATAARISESEEELSAVRSFVEERATHTSSHVADLKQTVVALAVRATALEEAEGEVARSFDESVSLVTGSVDHLAARLDSLTATVGTTGERLGEWEVDLHTRLSDITGRLDMVDREREVTIEATRAAARSHEVVGLRMEELAARLDATEDERRATSSEVSRLAAVLEVERASLRSRLDALAAAQEKWAETVGTGELEPQLDNRFEAFERDQNAMVAELDRVSSVLDEERASVQAQLDALAAALPLPASAPQSSSLEARLDELTRKVDDMDRRSGAVASDVSRAMKLWPTALRSLEARVDEIAPRSSETEPDFADQRRLAGLGSDIEQAEPSGVRAHAPEEVPEDEPSSRDTFGRPVTAVGAEVVRLRAADP